MIGVFQKIIYAWRLLISPGDVGSLTPPPGFPESAITTEAGVPIETEGNAFIQSES